MATTTKAFDEEFLDGDEYFDKYLYENGWVQLWRPAPYHWCAMHIEKMQTFEYVEGDLFKTQYKSEAEFLEGLKALKVCWVEMMGKSANPVLCGVGEKYGFLTWNEINLHPPKCKECGRLMYPTKEGTFECLFCDIKKEWVGE